MKSLKSLKRDQLIERYNGVRYLLQVEKKTNLDLRKLAKAILTNTWRENAIEIIKRFDGERKGKDWWPINPIKTTLTKSELISGIENEEKQIIEEIDIMLSYNKMLADVLRSAKVRKGYKKIIK